MKSAVQQQGFTLVEIAIVLVIIGLLIGGVLKGQELISSAKVKNYAADFRNTPLFIYAYQDKFRAIPGDDAAVSTHVNGGISASSGCGYTGCVGNGQLDGYWNSATTTDETYLFWQHVRLAGLTSGTTNTTSTDYRPRNASGGMFGIEAGHNNYIRNVTASTGYLPGAYTLCSSGITGKLAKQLDITIDDGNTQTGALRAVSITHTRGNAGIATALISDETPVTVCMGV